MILLSSTDFPHALAPISGYSSDESQLWDDANECLEGGRHDQNTPNELGGANV
jgi:hypothetical protein